VTPDGAGPRPDAFAALLGIVVDRIGPGRAVARLQTGPEHANPHGTVHGAVFYAVAGCAIAAAANDEQYSSMISAVHIDYLAPGKPGDELRAEAEVTERTEREDVIVARVIRIEGGAETLAARASARGARRVR
jgi:acyl-CoA thioesterase